MRHERPSRHDVEDLIRSTPRDAVESLMLADELLGQCWPGGQADRLEPAALGWLGVWGPTKLVAVVPECRCASGRCAICN